jgi:hypothetical protein
MRLFFYIYIETLTRKEREPLQLIYKLNLLFTSVNEINVLTSFLAAPRLPQFIKKSTVLQVVSGVSYEMRMRDSIITQELRRGRGGKLSKSTEL